MAEPRSTITRLAEGGAIGAGLAVMPGTDVDKQAKLPTGAGVRSLGVTLIKADAAGRPLTIVTAGQATCVAKSAIVPGDLLEVNGTDGKWKAAAPAKDANALCAGMALTSATLEDDLFEAEIAPSTMQGV
jgi:hypothetical protein